jgi:DNA-binding XRE family transcriptional regulator
VSSLPLLKSVRMITQERLAYKSDVSRVTIAWLEKGSQENTTWQNVVKLARAFGLTVVELLKGVDIDIEPAVA